MPPKGGKREGSGRPSRSEPKSLPIWCGQISDKDRRQILDNLTPEERFLALMKAVQDKTEVV